MARRAGERVASIYPDLWQSLAPDEWDRRVDAALIDAFHRGLRCEADAIRYLSLAAEYGWDFLDRADCAWMRRILEDARITDSSARIRRLFEECRRRAAVAAGNARQREEFLR